MGCLKLEYHEEKEQIIWKVWKNPKFKKPGVGTNVKEKGRMVKDVENEIDTIIWTIYDKVAEVVRVSGSSKPDILFTYDGMGRRLSKTVIPDRTDTTQNTVSHYVYDASGNLMAIYSQIFDNGEWEVKLEELVMYGSSRIGIYKPQQNKGNQGNKGNKGNKGKGQGKDPKKNLLFEINDHLGNVRAVVSGWKNKKGKVQVVDLSDMYPFGMPMPSRQFTSEFYPFGFNGMLKDDELKGNDNSLDFGNRMYDTRLGRFLSVDPLRHFLPSISNFIFATNSPIGMIELGGLWSIEVHLFENRKMGYEGVLIVKDHDGNIIDVYMAGGRGKVKNGTATARRRAFEGDTPLGTWKKAQWDLYNSNDFVEAYNKDPSNTKSDLGTYSMYKLNLGAYDGEPTDREPNSIALHASLRIQTNGKKFGINATNGSLWNTGGCVRVSLNDIVDIYNKTTIDLGDEEFEGFTVANDLDNLLESSEGLGQIIDALDTKIENIQRGIRTWENIQQQTGNDATFQLVQFNHELKWANRQRENIVMQLFRVNFLNRIKSSVVTVPDKTKTPNPCPCPRLD